MPGGHSSASLAHVSDGARPGSDGAGCDRRVTMDTCTGDVSLPTVATTRESASTAVT